MKRILVVDDDEDIVELVQSRLQANDFEVISASNGKEGIRQVQQERPDLVIMDIMMPELQGGEVVRILKANQATKDIPIIF